MAVTHVGNAAHNELDPTTSCTVTIPACNVDDILEIDATNRNANVDLSVTDDDTGGNAWALMIRQPADTDNRSGQVWWKRATAGTSGKTVTVAGATNSICAAINVYRGVDTGATPYEGVNGEKNASGDNDNAGSTVSAGSMVVGIVFHPLNNQAATDFLATDPSALTLRQHAESSGGSDCAVDHASAVRATAGATGTVSWTKPANIACSVVFAWKEAVAANAGGPPLIRRDHPALLANLRR